MNKPEIVAIHPIVLLSVVDHFNRVVGKNQNRRVVGCLLGEYSHGKLDVTNCYGIPFEEDPKESSVWFVDHNYHETMYSMVRKVNIKEKFIGWYTTGTKMKAHDIEINNLFKNYCSNPIFVVIDVQHSDEIALPTEVYMAEEQVTKDGTIVQQFTHLPSSVEAFLPEEIGVEHLLREIKDISITSIASMVQQKIVGLKGLFKKVLQIKGYLESVWQGKLIPNNQILFNIQEILNFLPDLNSEKLIKAFSAKNNDAMFVIYICSLTRSILALHTLINNKIENRILEKKQEEEGQTKKEAALNKENESKDKKEKKEEKQSSNKKENK